MNYSHQKVSNYSADKDQNVNSVPNRNQYTFSFYYRRAGLGSSTLADTEPYAIVSHGYKSFDTDYTHLVSFYLLFIYY